MELLLGQGFVTGKVGELLRILENGEIRCFNANIGTETFGLAPDKVLTESLIFDSLYKARNEVG